MPDDLFNFKLKKPKPTVDSSKPNPNDSLDTAFRAYHANPTPITLNAAVTAANPVIDYGVNRFGGAKSPLMTSRGRLLTAHAVKTWQPTAKASPKTWTMQQLQGLMRYRSKLDPISIPERLNQDSLHMRRASQDFSQQYGREPSIEELASLSGFSRKRLRKIKTISVGRVNESQFMDDEGDRYLPGVDNSSPEAIWTEMVYHDLDDRGKQIYDLLTGRLDGQQMSVNDVAKKMSLTPAAVSQKASRIRDMITEGVQMDRSAAVN